MSKLVKMAVLIAVSMLSVAGSAIAGDSRDAGIYKGSLRDVFPDAIYVDSYILNNAGTAGLSRMPIDAYQSEFRRYSNGFMEYGAEKCESQFHALEHFEVQIAFLESNLMTVGTANVVCFNLPDKKKTIPEPAEVKPVKKKK